MASRKFDVRLIPEFSGAATDTPILEWLEDQELTCELCEISKIERVLPLRLKGATRETYRQLSKEQRDDVEEIKRALIKAYGTDSFVAFEQFTTRCLRPEETADEFLTDLQRLARLVGETRPECWIKSAFVNGLPSGVKGLLWSSPRLETLTFREVLERASGGSSVIWADLAYSEHSQKSSEWCHLFQMRGPKPSGQRWYAAKQC